MAREILFKAKRIDNGEWVEGYLCKGKRYYDGKPMTIIMPINVEVLSMCSVSEYEIVDPNTICQQTGLTDKNGNKIWENDVLNVHQFLFDGNEYENEIIVSIEYMEEMMCFGANLIKAKDIKEYMGYATDDVEKVVHPFNDFYGLHEESYEVIGNIFDNPELLKEE